MSQYTPISLTEMRAVLRPENGWIELSPAACAALGSQSYPVKEHVFDWPIAGCDQPLRVMTSIEIGSGVTRDVGADAIRVFVPKMRKATRVFRVAGWRANLMSAVQAMLTDVRAQVVKTQAIPAPGASVSVPATLPPKTYSSVVATFAKATASGLKKPRIFFQVDGVGVEFKLMGAASKYAGQIAVTDGGPYGASQWFGAINQQGVWSKTAKVTPAVAAIVDGFNADPAGFGAKYGKKTGQCCFCHRHLETAESLHAGYGPVCADKWGLPWGEVGEDQTGMVVAEGGA